MSKKLLIIKALTTLLEDITVYSYVDENGDEQTVNYDLVGKVYRGRRSIGETEISDYAMSIMEAPRPQIGAGAGEYGDRRIGEWTLNIQGWPVDDKTHPSDPAYLMADAVERQLFRVVKTGDAVDPATGSSPGLYPEFMLGGLITRMQIANSVVLPAQENLSRFAFFYIPVLITLVQGT